MNMFIVFNGRFPSEKAASLFAAKSAEEFARLGITVELIIPKRAGLGTDDPFAYYGISKNFTITYIPIIDFFRFPVSHNLAFKANYLLFSLCTALYLLTKQKDVIFSNEFLPCVVCSLYCKNIFYEMHDFPESKIKLFGFFVKRFKWILIHNVWKTEKFISLFGVSRKKIITLFNAVDLKEFDIELSKHEARKKLGIPEHKNIVVYTGHLYSWKGIDTLIETASKMNDVLFYLVGGTEQDINTYKEKTIRQDNIIYTGHRPHTEMPIWQRASDCLVIPNTAKEDISKYYTSPMKLFEYMTSDRPIVASDIPSIREVVDESSVIFCAPDNPDALKKSIEKALGENHTTLVASAKKTVLAHSWPHRQKQILDFIQKNIEL